MVPRLGIEHRMFPGLRPVVVGLWATLLRALRAHPDPRAWPCGRTAKIVRQADEAPASRVQHRGHARDRSSQATAAGTTLDRLVTKLLTRALAVIVALDAVGLAIGCVLRRRRRRAAASSA
jgi:hypothetical protein